MGEVKEWIADLTDSSIKAYTNIGFGLTDDGISYTERGIEYAKMFSLETFPMYAVDFSEYLEEQELDIADMTSVEIVASIYNEAGEEMDFSMEYEKCAFVSADALDGYSESDILPKGNYKVLGSDIKTVFDLTEYTGYTADGTNLTDSLIEDGVGFNIQLVNGDIPKVGNFIISSLIFRSGEESSSSGITEKREKVVAEKPSHYHMANLESPGVVAYVNMGDGLTQDGINKFDGVIQFQYDYPDILYPMLAVDFSEYLKSQNIKMEDVLSFEIQLGIHDANGNEVDYLGEFEKCSFVTKRSLNGYGSSDILSTGNYKQLGSSIKTEFNLTEFDGSMPATVADGVGFNVQVVNGARNRIASFVLYSLRFGLR